MKTAGPVRPDQPLLQRGGVFKKWIMELELIRTYHLAGTNGKILLLPAGAPAKAGEGRLMMYSIELPWKDNRARGSCIPEGRYELAKRCLARRSFSLTTEAFFDHRSFFCSVGGSVGGSEGGSPKFDRHLLLMNVPGRNGILIHPANNALQELKGCIAPVSLITGAGKGVRSRLALETLTGLVYGALDRHVQVFLNIKSDPYEST